MRSIRNLEIHLVHSCNFTCESCSHYSNQRHKGMLSLDEAGEWMSLWNRRISPQLITLLGGEPTLHPHLSDFLVLARKSWPEAQLELVTNGSFLHRHPALPLILQKDPDARVFLTVHHDSPEYVDFLRPAHDLLKKWVREYGIRALTRNSFANWTRRYKGIGSAMEPYEDLQPRRSWEQCPAKEAAQLFEGKIWKCGPLAYLKLHDAKYHLSEKWEPYLKYRPLDAACTEEELAAFFGREDESFCAMCPANPEKFAIPLPIVSRSGPASGRALPSGAPLSSARMTGAHIAGMPIVTEVARPLPKDRPLVRSLIRRLALPLAEDKGRGWKAYPLFAGPTRRIGNLSCHVSVLSPGATPHPPHRHIEEEILIVLAGEADLVIPNRGTPSKAPRYRLRPGCFVYYRGYQPHTIHNPGPESVTYMMFKWRAEHAGPCDALASRIVRYQGLPPEINQGGYQPRRVLEGGTRHLRKLHCHVTTLLPGCGYRPHADPYDVAILVLQGTVKVLGGPVGRHGLVFCAAGEPHGMKNVGAEPAIYLVFEFHGHKNALVAGERTRDAVPGLAPTS